ncbi:MAG: hypothetical protein ACRDO8_01740 [Nocardioidaceae bacterium]
MLRLYDTRTREMEEIVPVRRGQLRMDARGLAVDRDAHVGVLRTLLLPDLVRRIAELDDLRVTIAGALADAFSRDTMELNILPAEVSPRTSQPADLLVDLDSPHDEAEGARPEPATGRDVAPRRVRTGHLLFEGRTMATSAGASAGDAVLLSDVSARGLDPLALRLALLGHGYRQRAELTWDDLHATDKALARWRDTVAAWAESPSAPMSDTYVREAVRALDEDLDTPRALRVVRRLEEDGTVAPGAKFETLAYLDRVLGLDLARDVGKPRRSPQPPA